MARWMIASSLTLFIMLFVPASAQSSAQLPKCRYDDVATPHQDYADWPYTLLDTIYKLPESYAPQDLTSISEAGFVSELQMRSLVLGDLSALAQAASEAGHPIAVQSAYRSYDYQIGTFNYWVAQQGLERARKLSARPGHSEHQLGTALDFRSEDGPPAWDLDDWAQTPAGAWIVANAWRYGFIMSYPKGEEAVTCYAYEPWHYRYVGREVAQEVQGSGLTLREWLWQHQGDSP